MTTPLLQSFPSLATYSEQDLKDLLSDETFLQAFLYSLPQVAAVLDEHEKLSLQNEELAKKNLALQNDLIALRTATTSAYTTAQHMKDRWVEVSGKQTTVYQKYRPSFLHLRLVHSTSSQDALTESLASQFIESGPSSSLPGSRVDSPAFGMSANANTSSAGTNGQSLEEFVRAFKAARKVYHKRAMWLERWNRGEVAWRED